MNEERFWKLIGQSRKGNPECEEQAEKLTSLLESLTLEEIVEFDRLFGEQRVRAYRWDLWAVAYIVNGGCSDDGFEYFRCWLIGQGKEAYERVLASPESVGTFVPEDAEYVECEPLLYAANHAYERLTKRELSATEIDYPSEPLGERWKEEDLERLYPVLCARFYP